MLTQRQTPNQVGHEANLLVWVVLLVQEVLVAYIQTSLCLLLLLPAVLVLQLIDGYVLGDALAELVCSLVIRSLGTLRLDLIHLLTKIALTLRTHDGIAATAKSTGLSSLRLLLRTHDSRLPSSLLLLYVHHILHVGRHVGVDTLTKSCWPSRHIRCRRLCLLLHGGEPRNSRLGVGLVRILVDVRQIACVC